MAIRRNILANFVGQAWSAIMGLAFLPLYIKQLGAESFGLIGFFATLQAWLTVMDMGLTPALSREMARFSAGALSIESVRNLLRSMEAVSISIAASVALLGLCSASYVAEHWLNAEALSDSASSDALSIMGVIIGLRILESLYRGALLGLQKQVTLNVANVFWQSLRHIGAATIVLFYSTSILTYLLWELLVAGLSLITFGIATYRSLPGKARFADARASWQALSEVKAFATGMLGITTLSLLLTNADKLLLSGLLPLNEFGYYALAATVAGGLYTLVSPITQALYPRWVALAAAEIKKPFAELFHLGAQIVSALVLPAAFVLSVFSDLVVYVWSGNAALAEHISPTLSLLVVGTAANCLMWVPYQCQLAHGWTRLALTMNVVSVGLLIPALLWIAPRYGSTGAASVWIVLNLGYVAVAPHFLHRRILIGEKANWYLRDVFRPAVTSATVTVVGFLARPAWIETRLEIFLYLALVAGIAFYVTILQLKGLRTLLLKMLRK